MSIFKNGNKIAGSASPITSVANISDVTNKRFVTDVKKAVLENTSGTNTGDETQSSIITKIGTGALQLSQIDTAGIVSSGRRSKHHNLPVSSRGTIYIGEKLWITKN